MQEIIITEAKEEGLQAYKEWGKELMSTQHTNAQESLQYENLLRESAYLVSIEGKPYIIHISETKEGETIKPADPLLEVNQKHKKYNQAVLNREARAIGEMIYDISID